MVENTVFHQAVPVWREENGEPNQYAVFRQSFVLTDIPKNPILKIRADNRYAVWVNGKYLSAQQYSDYDFYRVYDEIAIPFDMLCLGTNVLAILGYCQNEDSSIYRKGTPSLIFEVTDSEEVLASSDADTICSAVTGFTSGAVEKISVQLSYSFCYDANIENRTDPAYTPGDDWSSAVRLPCHGSYSPRPIRQLTVGQKAAAEIIAQGIFKNGGGQRSGERIDRAWLSHRPFEAIASGIPGLPCEDGIVLTAKDGDGIYVVIDLKRETAGYACLEFDAGNICDIDVGWGEHLEDLRVRSDIDGRNFAFSYRAKKGQNRFFYPIKRLGLRYLQMHIHSHNIRLFYAGVLAVEYPLRKQKEPPKGLSFLQRRIYNISADTLGLCMHEHYEDCPWREQALYAMDSRNQMLFTYLAFGETDYPKANLRLLGLGQGEDGLLELCAPARVDSNIPSFSLIWITALCEYLQQTDDTDFMREMLPVTEKILSFFYDRTHDGLIENPQGYWGFYEWAPHMDGTSGHYDGHVSRDGFDSPLNAFYAMALHAAEVIYRAVGLEKQADELSNRQSLLKKRYTEVFWSEEKRAYRLGTAPECTGIYPQLVQALTVCAGLCENENNKKSLTSRLFSDEFWPKATLSHCIYLYQAAAENPDMHSNILKDVDEKWGNMLFSGATSFWETEKGAADFNGAGSLCHGWSAVPIWVYLKLLGE